MIQQIRRLLGKKYVVTITGAAGTGKTTQIKEIVEDSGYECILLAPTGKAARRIHQVTQRAARTIHSVIFHPPDDEDEPEWSKIRRVGGPGCLIVVDEASMVDQKLFEALLMSMAKGTRLLLVGDPNQLPPVNGKSCLDFPDIELTHVWRNDEDVLSFAHSILGCETGEELLSLINNPNNPSVHIRSMRDMRPTQWKMEQDSLGVENMLLTLKNKTRYAINKSYRHRARYDPDNLSNGERLLVRTNNLTHLILNGEIIHYQDGGLDMDMPGIINASLKTDENRIFEANILSEGLELDAFEFVKKRRAYSNTWLDYIKETMPRNETWHEEVHLLRANVMEKRRLYGPASRLVHVQHGYCETAHVAQGSECDKVGILWDTDWLIRTDFKAAKAWWYTAATRARNEINIWRE